MAEGEKIVTDLEGAAPVAAEPVVAPVVEAAPVVENAAPVVEAPAAPESTPTLLQTAVKNQEEKLAAVEAKPDAKPEDKPAEAKPAEAAKPAEPEAKPAEAASETPKEPAPLEPVEYEYKLPESFKMDDTMKAEVKSAFDKFRADPKEGAQELANIYVKNAEAYRENLLSEQKRVFNEQREAWRTEIMSDPALGGAGFKTVEGAVARMRDMLVPSKFLETRKFPDGSPRLSAFDEFCEYTGAGDHPVFWHMLHNAARYFDEAKQPAPNPQPPKDIGKRPPARLRDVYASRGG